MGWKAKLRASLVECLRNATGQIQSENTPANLHQTLIKHEVKEQELWYSHIRENIVFPKTILKVSIKI